LSSLWHNLLGPYQETTYILGYRYLYARPTPAVKRKHCTFWRIVQFGEYTIIKPMSYIASWSGDKDSCFAVHGAIDKGYEFSHLVNFIFKEFHRVSFHGTLC